MRVQVTYLIPGTLLEIWASKTGTGKKSIEGDKSVTTREKYQFHFEILRNSEEHVLKLPGIENIWEFVCIGQLSFCHWLRHASKKKN